MFPFKSAERVLALFTSAAKPKPLFRPNALLRSSHHGGVLPQELSSSVIKLTCQSTTATGGICHVYVIGTLPFSGIFQKDISLEDKKNIHEVKALINSLKPEVVLLGLCPSRAPYLKTDQIATGFQIAYEEAQKYRANVILGDRSSKITYCRLLDGPSLTLSLLHIMIPNLMWDIHYWISCNDAYPLPKTFESLWKNALVKEPAYESRCKKYFLDERDQYISAKLLNVARQHSSVVAVVGDCHLTGGSLLR